MATPENGETHSNNSVSVFDHFWRLALKGLRQIFPSCKNQSSDLDRELFDGFHWRTITLTHCCIQYRNQSFDFHYKTNDWFLYEMHYWVEIG